MAYKGDSLDIWSLRVPPNDSVSIHLDHRVQISSISLADGSEEKAFPNSLPFELGVNQLYVQYLEKPDRTLSALVCALSISHPFTSLSWTLPRNRTITFRVTGYLPLYLVGNIARTPPLTKLTTHTDPQHPGEGDPIDLDSYILTSSFVVYDYPSDHITSPLQEDHIDCHNILIPEGLKEGLQGIRLLERRQVHVPASMWIPGSSSDVKIDLRVTAIQRIASQTTSSSEIQK